MQLTLGLACKGIHDNRTCSIVYGWLETDMSFYSNAPDNMVVIMDSGDLEVLYGAAGEAGYEKLMEVMEGIGEAL